MAVEHAADPNIIIPSIIAAIPVTLAAVAGMIVTLRSVRKRSDQTNTALTDLHDEVRTNHGKRNGEYVEMIGPLVEWAADHSREDNELRHLLGLPAGRVLEIEDRK